MNALRLLILFFVLLFAAPSQAERSMSSRLWDTAVQEVKPYGEKEVPEDRAARINNILKAAEIVSKREHFGWKFGPEEMFALLVATSYEEGDHWRLTVHLGTKKGDRGKAACLNQLHKHYIMMPNHVWEASMGTDLESTIICMEGAARWFAHYSKTCVSPWSAKRDVLGSFTRIVTGYGTGKRCSGNPKFARDRAYRAVRYLKIIKGKQ